MEKIATRRPRRRRLDCLARREAVGAPTDGLTSVCHGRCAHWRGRSEAHMYYAVYVYTDGTTLLPYALEKGCPAACLFCLFFFGIVAPS